MDEICKLGEAGEQALNQWLKDQQLSYVAVCQAKETFSHMFIDGVKRPDFLVLFESIGLIAVDAKNYTLWKDSYSLNIEAELKKSLAFERLFRIPLWYAYYDNTGGHESWYWISALKAAEVGQERKNSDKGEKFLAIKLDEFEHISEACDLAKLYTHRLPGISKLATL